jgi:hypothetical protein
LLFTTNLFDFLKMTNNDADEWSLATLPHLVVLEIGMHLPNIACVASVAQTCKRLSEILSHRFVWRAQYEKAFGHAFSLCCIDQRESNNVDWKQFADGLNVERHDKWRASSALCQTLLARVRLDKTMRQSTVDFCCNHWREIFRRRVVTTNVGLFERRLTRKRRVSRDRDLNIIFCIYV